MTLGEFVEKYKGAKVDFDGMHGAQCVDLARRYFKDVWGIPQPEGVIGAKDFANAEGRPVQGKYAEFVQMTAIGQRIPAGAVVVFRETATNPYGHIGICLRCVYGDKNAPLIELFEQDGFKQDGAKIGLWRYNTAAGYLVKRGGDE